MEQQPPLRQPTDAQRLWDLYHQAAHTLRATLPPPLADTPEEFERRDQVALGFLASVSPANADEVALASQYVAAHSYAMDCMRLMRECPGTPDAKKLGAEARSTMREARGARTLLLRVQKERHQREKDNAACKQDGWSRHIALELMSEALGYAPPAPAAVLPPEPAPVAEPLPPMPAPVAGPLAPMPAPEVVQASAPAGAPPPAQPSPAPQPAEDGAPPFDGPADADRYAIVYPRRAALIRQRGGVPDDCDFGPPKPELVPFIATGTSPVLRALDSPATAAT